MLRCTTLTYGCLSLVATALQRMLCIGLLSSAACSFHLCSRVAAALGAVPHVQQLQNVAAAVLAVAVHWPVAAVSLPAATPAQHQLHLHAGHQQAINQGTAIQWQSIKHKQAIMLQYWKLMSFKLQRTLFSAVV